MATISYKCDTCKRSIELVENPQGFTVVGKCVITNGCIGRLYRTERNPNNVRESNPTYVEGLNNYVPRRAFFEFAQTLSSNKWKVVHNMGVLPSTFVYLQQEDGTYAPVDNSTYTVSAVDKNTVMLTFAQKVRGLVQCVAKSTVPLVPTTLPPDSTMYQVSANGVITFAVPKYLTQIHGQIPPVSPPVVSPTVTPSPTPTSTPVPLPLNLCQDGVPIQVEIEITKPNEDPFVCFEDISSLIDNRSPWTGWNEVLVGKRRNYCIRTASILDLKVFGDADLEAGDIPNGTRIRFLRIDYGTGRKEKIPSRGLLMLLAKTPYQFVDKVKDKLVDVGELIGDTPDYFVYQDGEIYLDETKVEKTYPDISRVIYQVAPPQPSPTPTPTVSPTVTLTLTATPTSTPVPTSTVTPSTTVGVSATPTPTVSGTAAVTPTITPTLTPTPTSGPSDPFWANVIAVMDGNVAGDLTTFTEGKGFTVTSNGTGTHTTIANDPDFGSSVMSLGSGGQFAISGGDPLDLINTDFTIECFFVLDGPVGVIGGYGSTLVERESSILDNYVFRIQTNALEFVYPGLSFGFVNETWVIGQLYHVAISRQGTQHYLSVNGVTTPVTITARTADIGGVINFGATSYGGIFNGRITYRLTRNVARYTSNYTVPSLPFPLG